jgi:hypothetical protein
MHGLVFVGALGDSVIPVLAQADSRGPHGSEPGWCARRHGRSALPG